MLSIYRRLTFGSYMLRSYYTFLFHIYSLNKCITSMISPYFMVPYKLFSPQLVNMYDFLICTRKKLKYNRNLRTQNEINSVCVRGLALNQKNIMVILWSKYKQRFTRPHRWHLEEIDNPTKPQDKII